MNEIIKDCLENRQECYILPFLWLHGESKERVKEEILAIKQSGIRQLCAESRPYERFCQDEWWEDFGFILKTARELDMGVWLLDDRAFPTGYANGYLEKEENAHLRKRLVREFQIEAMGPAKATKLYIGGRVYEGERVLKVIAYQHKTGDKGEVLDPKGAIDLTPCLCDGMVYWDVPKGVWRVCVVVETRIFAHQNDRFFYYIDMLSAESCHAMIDGVYQPHYDRFKDYFGNTFKGFFSDEPGFLNVLNTYKNSLGIMESPYPWRGDLPSLIAKSANISEAEAWLYLPALWEDLGTKSVLMRTHYMEVVTRQYRENFSLQLGNWCRDHGVMYIGHVIEDMGAHTRLGYGSGHYFRALDGQDMAGIDIVLTQDIPGFANHTHRALLADGGEADPAFFRYTLPKLASSHAHIQPLKKGRAMCEIFGAFGWAEGLPYMKGLADIMLASGINCFVPHAFSPKEEDTDCPPHFYNGGKNQQFPHFGKLMGYMERCAHMLKGGLHKADVAVFYNAEGEWAGGKYELFYDICRTLTQNNIDFDIIPQDTLKEAEVKNNRLLVNGEDYGALIVSRCESLPRECLSVLNRLSTSGLDVIFVNGAPSKTAEGEAISKNSAFETVTLKSLLKNIKGKGYCQLSCQGKGTNNLRFYHVQRGKEDIYLFSNEGIYEDLEARVFLKQSGECLIYEPWHNKCYRGEAKNSSLDLHLEKGNMLFVIFGNEVPSYLPIFKKEAKRVKVEIPFDISIKQEGESEYRMIEEASSLFDISAPDKYPEFSGNVCYEGTFIAKKGFEVLDLGQVGEVAEVWLNGICLGTRINAPYKFDMAGAQKTGENRLKVVVTANLAHRRRDLFSTFIQIPPTGVLGDICLCRYN